MSLSGETETENGADGQPPRSELTEHTEALKRLSIFQEIPFEMIRLCAYTSREKSFSGGDLIFRQGEAAREAYLILSGRVTLFIRGKEKEVPLQELEADGFFGYMALLARYDWPINARAAADTRLLILDRESFAKILIRYPEKGLMIVEKLVQMRIRRMQRHMRLLAENVRDDDESLTTLVDRYALDRTEAPSEEKER